MNTLYSGDNLNILKRYFLSAGIKVVPLNHKFDGFAEIKRCMFIFG